MPSKAWQLDTPCGNQGFEGILIYNKPFTACLHVTISDMFHDREAAQPKSLRVNSYVTIQTESGFAVILHIKEAFMTENYDTWDMK